MGHMWNGRYWLIKVDTIVSAELSGIGKSIWPTCKVINYCKNMLIARVGGLF